jgi:hypothetical protein
MTFSVLIDNGSPAVIIDSKYVERLSLKIHKLRKPFKFSTAFELENRSASPSSDVRNFDTYLKLQLSFPDTY